MQTFEELITLIGTTNSSKFTMIGGGPASYIGEVIDRRIFNVLSGVMLSLTQYRALLRLHVMAIFGPSQNKK
jgi:hypothetical protein